MQNFTVKYAFTFMIIFYCESIWPGTSTLKGIINATKLGRSSGCGISQVGTGNFMPMALLVLNQYRTYHIFVPSNYDTSHAYPLVFRWHGSGGNGLSGGLNIEYSSGNDAIVVAADGINGDWEITHDSVDLLLFDKMLDSIENNYCIDRDRVFSYGFSVGAFFTNLLACERGDELRASASVAGGLSGGNCIGRVASWFLQDQDDNVVPFALGKATLDRAIERNGCSSNTIDESDGCVSYQGCEKNPVVWCQSNGFGHNIRGDFAPKHVWKFFLNLR